MRLNERQRYVSRIKPELLNVTLWSLENYDEYVDLTDDDDS